MVGEVPAPVTSFSKNIHKNGLCLKNINVNKIGSRKHFVSIVVSLTAINKAANTKKKIIKIKTVINPYQS